VQTVGVITAAIFAVFCGINDGGALIVTSLKIAVRPLTAALVLAAAVALVPVVFGAEVARTLSHRLVGFGGPDSATAVDLAVGGAIVVVVLLSWRGLPTSLTLALVGGIVGVGLGGGLPVSGGWILTVLVLAAAAPLIGMVIAVGVTRLWRRLPLRMAVGEQARRVHPVGLAMLAFAYGANDGQKILGVFALEAVAGSPFDPDDASVWLLLAIGGLFLVGTLIGTARTGDRLGAAVRTLTPVDAVTAQLSSALAVTGSALVGAPASMTQSLTGALIGSGLAHSGARVRWQHAVAILAAWLLTFPLAVALVAVPAAFLIRS
jgi:Phosphate/sulphate permeases